MGIITDIYQNLRAECGIVGIASMIVLVITFFVQLYYYLAVFSKIKKTASPKDEFPSKGVSVVVTVDEQDFFIEETLPLLLSQDCPLFEIVIVNLHKNDEFTESLLLIEKNNHRVKICSIDQKDQRFSISQKMALNLGIKAANYNNIVLTTVNFIPESQSWLSAMALGFNSGDIVISYCGMQKGKGLTNLWMRCCRFSNGLRTLSAAYKLAYKANENTLGLTKELYFNNGGFNFLNLNLGVDDLFLQKIATPNNVALVLCPEANSYQRQWGDMKWFSWQRRFENAAKKYYTTKAKIFERREIFSRFFMFASIILLFIFTPLVYALSSLILLAIRMVAIIYICVKKGKILSEKGLWAMYLLYDFVSLFSELRLKILGILKPSHGIWR